ncbi:hypothetical protein FRC02_005766 [Tulasnella sp. 418]|nr:hypothetical protein FRC02_005766 [Tulasnella sp. 418]
MEQRYSLRDRGNVNRKDEKSKNPKRKTPSDKAYPCKATVRLELLDFDQYQEPGARPTISYIDTNVEEDSSGTPCCLLSDVLPKAAALNSPLKDPNMKLWRLDPQRQLPLVLGPADIVSNRTTNRECLFERSIIDKHRLKAEEIEGGFEILSGVQILMERRSKIQFDARPVPQPPHNEAQSSFNPITDPAAENKPDNNSTGSNELSNDSSPALHNPHLLPDPGVDSDRDSIHVAKIAWLRKEFKVDPRALPGKVLCATARHALDRHILVLAIKEQVRAHWHSTVPQDAPALISGQRIPQEDLMEALGFSSSLWFSLHKRWDVHNSHTGIKGAENVIAWTRNPDARAQDNPQHKMYHHLNHAPLNSLNGIVSEDKLGKYLI